MGRSGADALMSMTGFAVETGALEDWAWTVEIRSVNGRGLELRLRVPDWVEGFEPGLRKMCQARLARGNVTVNVRLQRAADAGAARVSEPALAAALAALEQVETAAEAAGMALGTFNAVDIAGMRGVMEQGDIADAEDTAPLRQALLQSAETALAAFEADRAREGAALAGVISEQIDRIEALSGDAAKALGPREEAARAALQRSLKRLLEASEMPSDERLLQEMALIAVKSDVTEELDRLAAHVKAARGLLSQEGPVGRKLDFLMQEFNRETNTLCSKSQSGPLTAIGLDLKAVIEQMREQVQNVE